MARGKNKKPRSERRQKKREVDAIEAYEMAILDDVSCPVMTMRRASDICNQAIEDAILSFKFLNTADHVWREEPANTELHQIVVDLRAELERHVSAIAALVPRVEPLLEGDPEHEDIDPHEVMRRLEAHMTPPDEP